MLPAEDYDTIIVNLLHAQPSNLGAITVRVSVAFMVGVYPAAVSIGILGAIFEWDPEALHFFSARSIAAIIVWVVPRGFWLATSTG